jgi:hypothetical protein
MHTESAVVEERKKSVSAVLTRNACNWHKLHHYEEMGEGGNICILLKDISNVKVRSSSCHINMILFHRPSLESPTICNCGLLVLQYLGD